MAATPLRRRKEGLLASVDMMNQDHPMLHSYETARESVNSLLRYIWILETIWPKKHIMTSSLSSIVDQLVRSATSVTANIQEGFGKATRESLAVFLRIARGSLYETIDHLVTLGVMIEIEKVLWDLKDSHAHISKSWKETQILFDKEFLTHTETSIRILDETMTHENSLSKKRKLSDEEN